MNTWRGEWFITVHPAGTANVAGLQQPLNYRVLRGKGLVDSGVVFFSLDKGRETDRPAFSAHAAGSFWAGWEWVMGNVWTRPLLAAAFSLCAFAGITTPQAVEAREIVRVNFSAEPAPSSSAIPSAVCTSSRATAPRSATASRSAVPPSSGRAAPWSLAATCVPPGRRPPSSGAPTRPSPMSSPAARRIIRWARAP